MSTKARLRSSHYNHWCPMIHESRYWKAPPLQIAKRLRALKAKPGKYLLTDRAAAQFERDIFLGFYSVRKLIEAPAKLTDTTKEMRFNISYYANRAATTWMTRHELDDLYDFTKERKETKDITFICNRIIHSSLLSGQFVNKFNRLFSISAPQL